jgi:hypothetical protein
MAAGGAEFQMSRWLARRPNALVQRIIAQAT